MRWLVTVVAGFAVWGCTCKTNVNKVNPSLGVTPAGVDFGKVKLGESGGTTLKFAARTPTAVEISSITLVAGSAPGPITAFVLGTKPTRVEANSSVTLPITFTPVALEAYDPILVIVSNDTDHPTIRVPIAGEGARPIIEVTPECAAARGCTGTVTVTPPAIDFGMQPLHSATTPDPTKQPAVNVVNAGPVTLKVTKVEFSGADAAAFSTAGNSMLPAAGLELEPSAGFNLQLLFKPTSANQPTYDAILAIESDDADHPRVTVALHGTLRPNQAPSVCANLIRVVPPPTGDAPRDYGTVAQWMPLLIPPAGGYDFTVSRDVRPGDLAVFSAISDSSDVTKCSSDPEDGRTGLTFAWRLISTPPGVTNLALAGAATSQAQLRPIATGDYVIELSVKDSQLMETTVRMHFAVAIKQDLVVQLQWPGFSDVDLDLHLVRPSAVSSSSDPFSGVFSFFSAGTGAHTSGDLNGFSVTTQKNMPGSAFDFDWGMPGSSDDPALNVDDTGGGPLIENASLNYPENDALCATASCTYKVLVHYFKDQRNHTPASCVVTGDAGCGDGDSCTCATAERCVADGAPLQDAGVGAGKCYAAPKPQLKIFLKGSPTPAKVIPLDTLSPPDDLVIGAPCQMLYVADVAWPAKTAIGSLPDGGTPPAVITVRGADGTGRVTAPLIGRFGYRQAGGSLQCSPDVTINAVQWYSRQP